MTDSILGPDLLPDCAGTAYTIRTQRARNATLVDFGFCGDCSVPQQLSLACRAEALILRASGGRDDAREGDNCCCEPLAEGEPVATEWIEISVAGSEVRDADELGCAIVVERAIEIRIAAAAGLCRRECCRSPRCSPPTGSGSTSPGRATCPPASTSRSRN